MEPNFHPASSLLLLVIVTISWLQAWTTERAEHPKVTIGPERLNGTLGETVLLPVSLDKLPTSGTIVWKFQGEPPTKIAEVILDRNKTTVRQWGGFKHRTHLFPNFTLMIQNLTMSDQGQYRVIVSVGALEPEAFVWLDVYEPIRGTLVKISNVSFVNQTCVATLTCSTAGGSAVSYSWEPGTADHFPTADGRSVEVSRNLSSTHSAPVCTTRNPVSWQNDSVDMTRACRTDHAVMEFTSGSFTISVASCGAVFFILVAAGIVCWSNRGRSGRWEDRTSAKAGADGSQGTGRYQARKENIQVVILRSDSMPSPEPVPTPPLQPAGPEESDYSEIQAPAKTPPGVLETEV
ncbi:hepatic and glial cell adhesion molecule-like [Scyliorhinus torazame]|uniref:hepatic and glial cell adhesion molecule-like n=1 Tax=Scyliorhinus torazame TaxID=75743 RepID=UPI003B5B52EF